MVGTATEVGFKENVGLHRGTNHGQKTGEWGRNAQKKENKKKTKSNCRPRKREKKVRSCKNNRQLRYLSGGKTPRHKKKK